MSWIGQVFTKLSVVAALGALALGQSQVMPSPDTGTPGREVRLLAGPIVQNLKDTSATIFWITNADAGTILRYGIDRDHPDQSAIPQNPNPRSSGNFQEFSARLTNLQPNKPYYFQIVSCDGQLKGSGTFETEPTGYAQNEIVITDGPVIEFLDSNNAEIAWSTNLPSSTLVRYGDDPNALVKTARAPWGQNTHRIALHDLKPQTTYYFVVESAEAKGVGTMAKSAEAQLSTPAAGEQALTNIVPAQ